MYITLAKIAVMVAVAVTAYVFYLKWQNAETKLDNVTQQLEQAESINAENLVQAKKAAARAEEDRKATAKAIEKNKELVDSGSKIKTENNNDPEANTLAGPAWDRFGDRLRNRQIGH